MRMLAPLFNTMKKSFSTWDPSITAYQTVFKKHGISLTYEQANPPQGVSISDHVKTILDNPEIQTQWCSLKKGYSTIQEQDALSSEIMGIMDIINKPPRKL